jgi:hypothetical protein
MLLLKSSEKNKLGNKTITLGIFLGNHKNLIKILKKSKIVGKLKNYIFFQK